MRLNDAKFFLHQLLYNTHRKFIVATGLSTRLVRFASWAKLLMLLPNLVHERVFDLLHSFLLGFIQSELLVEYLINFELDVKSYAVDLRVIIHSMLHIVWIQDVLFEHLHQSALQQLVHCRSAINFYLNT